MKLEKLILENFLTYDSFQYTFKQKPLQIQGLNLTDNNQKSCGSGKSGIQTAIEFCITGTNSRGVRDINLITFEKPFSKIQLFASCDFRKQHLHINWKINRKGSNTLELKTKDYNQEKWVKVDVSGVADGKTYIDNWFAISKDDLFNYFLISKKRFKSFFASSNKEKVDLINRFSDASIIEGLESINTEELDSAYKQVETKINNVKGAINQVNSQIEREQNRDFKTELEKQVFEINEKIKDLEKSIEEKLGEKLEVKEKNKNSLKKIQNKEDKIKEKQANKADIELEIETITDNIKTVKDELKTAKNELENFVSENWEEKRKVFNVEKKESEKELKKEKLSLQDVEKKENKVLNLINQISLKLDGAITCPKCDHKFLLDEDLEGLTEKEEKAKNLKPFIKQEINTIEKTIDEIKVNITALESNISNINKAEGKENEEKQLIVIACNKVEEKLRTVNRKLDRLESELKDNERDIESLKSDIKNLNSKIDNRKDVVENINSQIAICKEDINKYKLEIDHLKLGNNKKVVDSLNKDLKKLEAEQSVLKTDLLKLADQIHEKKEWGLNFKQFRMFIANQSLEVIQYHCNRYLDGMGSDMRIKMNGFKVRADGTVKEEITANVIRDREREFDSFSGGEKSMLLFASILANRFMINETHPHGGLDFLSIDEVLEGADSLILKHVIEAAKKINIAVMIITHVTDEEANSDRILIVKENNISKIQE